MMSEERKFRLVTRSDFDGLVCAVLLRDLGLIGEIKFVHPKDMQDGKVELSNSDITTNLPYNSCVHLAFDHHHSEMIRVEDTKPNLIIDESAESAARVLYNYYGGKKRFPNISESMMEAVDKGDAAQFSQEDILNPTGWVLLHYIMDPRTGLGRFRDFKVSNYQLMMDLIDYCKEHTIDEILQLPDVKERVDLFHHYKDNFIEQIKNNSTVYDNLVVLDLRDQEIIYPGNRFMIFVLFPECSISIHVIWGYNRQNTVFAVGKSIVNGSSSVDIGELMLEYGGGGHENAGTCQVDNDKADEILAEIVDRIR